MLGFTINKVTGNSMFPVLPANSFVFLSSWFNNQKLSDKQIVKVVHPTYGHIIKKIKYKDELGNYWLEGFGIESVTTEQMGAISPEDVVGIVVCVIK